AYVEQGRTFGEEEIQLLSRFGHLASLALESARLYEAVRVSEERFRTLVSNVPGVIFRALLLEGRWQFEFISDAIEELSGYPAEEFLEPEHPRSFSSLVHPNDFPAVQEAFEDAARGGTAYALEYRIVHRDGNVRWVLERGLGIPQPDGTRVLDSALFDITEQKAAEEERARLAAIVEFSDDAIMSATLDGNIESWNRGAEELYGYSAEEALGRPISILAPSDRPDEPAELLAEIRNGERTSHHETVRTRKDGTKVDVSLTTSPIHDASGEITGASAIARDITERKRAEEALQQKTALLELLQDIAETANGSSTVEEALQACLDRVCAHTGWPVGHVYLPAEDTEDLVPTSIWHLGDADAFDAFRVVSEAIRFVPGVGLPGRVLASGKPLWLTDVSKDQNFPRARWAEEAGLRAGFAFPVLTGTEVAAVLEFFWTEAVEPDLQLLAVVGHIGTQLGRVVERARAEAALRQSAEHHRSIIETANDAFVAMDRHGAITDWNRRAEHTFGWSRDEVIGLPLAQTIITPEYRDALKEGIAHFLATGEATVLEKPLELTALHRDGREFPIELKIWPVLAGRGYRFNAFVRDVTERRSLEEQLRQSQKMEAVGTLAGGVAHDFNNLLTAIGGYSELLLAELESDDVSRKRVEEIKRAAERAASLTSQLLAFSRKQIVQPTALDLNAVVADTEKMLRRLIGEHIELVTSPAEELGHVRADRGQLEQVIVNLAVNARDAMPGGGRLTIATASVDLDEVSARQHGVDLGTYVELAVTDTGCGMDDKVQAHVFEPFFTTKEQGKGTGLGLATVYGIIQGSGGYITVESTPGGGTTFALYLPVTQEPTELGPAPSENGSPRGAETVLLVEDEDVVRDLVCEILRLQGYAVLPARGGEEALEICGRHEGSIQVLLTDLVMPDMSGRDLAERVSSLRPDAKVIYMSGYTNDAIVHHGVRDAEVAFLQKPFTSDELAHKLREVLEGTPGNGAGREGSGQAGRVSSRT
ncbi:MAG: PAS domain S-box protein, partial [Gaiellaceae bacterium]